MTDLLESLGQAIDAKVAHDTAMDAYDGYEWSYHGFHLAEDMDKAGEDFINELRKVIREEIEACPKNNSTKSDIDA